MRKMPGMEDAVRSKLQRIDGISLVKDDGQLLATMRATGDANQQGLVSEYEILRGDLCRILYDMTKDNKRIEYIFGEQVAAMKQTDDGPVAVEFANGSPAAEYDLVVACDGATSRTRAIGLECGVRDHITSINSWSAYFAVKDRGLNTGRTGLGMTAIGGRFLAIGQDEDGVNQINLTKIYPRSEKDATLPYRQAQKAGTDELKEYIAQQFRGMPWKTNDVLEALMESKDLYTSELVQVKVPQLSRGRFVLVGDAGYAPGPIGTGTSLALGGAYILAGEIANHPGDLAAGLQSYEERMAPILKDMQKIPPGVPGIMAPQTAWGIWLRNLVFRILCWSIDTGNRLSWLTSSFSRAFASDEYKLPEYPWIVAGEKEGS